MNYRSMTIIFAALFLFLALVVKFFGEDFFPNAQLFLVINGAQSSLLNSLMIALSEYGREYFWIPVLILLWVFGHEEERKGAFLLALAFILAIVLGEASKILVNQPRPYALLPSANLLAGAESDSAFPSGHAVIVSTGSILAFSKLSKRIAIPLTLEALLVSYSRVYVGLHWPIDLLGGWTLGGFCAMLILFEASRFEPVYKLTLDSWNRLTHQQLKIPILLRSHRDIQSERRAP